MIDINNLIEIKFKDPDDFLKIKETLSRIGIVSSKDKILYQSCHILHKQGKYYIVHFKEMFLLDNKYADYNESDMKRRNTIANLLHDWGLLTLVDKNKSDYPSINLSQIKVIPYKEKENWTFITKYTVGRKIRHDK